MEEKDMIGYFGGGGGGGKKHLVINKTHLSKKKSHSGSLQHYSKDHLEEAGGNSSLPSSFPPCRNWGTFWRIEGHLSACFIQDWGKQSVEWNKPGIKEYMSYDSII